VRVYQRAERPQQPQDSAGGFARPEGVGGGAHRARLGRRVVRTRRVESDCVRCTSVLKLASETDQAMFRGV